MTRRSKKDCIEAAINLSVVVASTGAIDGQDRLALLLHPAETPHSNHQLHLKQ
jgi:hypothetical protein